MDDKFTFTLKNPITDEQWDKITDADFEHTDRIWFETKNGKVEFLKAPAQPEIVRCKDCKHRPFDGEDTRGFGVEFPDEKCPCQCDDGWYNWRPNNEWFCANAERREDG